MTVIGESVFATHIANPGELDWRRSHHNVTYRSYELPGTVLGGIHRLMRSLGLIFGALDFVLTDGDHHFIENQSEWAMGMDRAADRPVHLPRPRRHIERGTVTGASAIGPHAGVDSDETRALRGEMVTALINDGVLTDDRWCDAFRAVPRHVLVPIYYHASEQINGEADRESWLRLVYSDTTLITQRRCHLVGHHAQPGGDDAARAAGRRRSPGPSGGHRHRVHRRPAVRAPGVSPGDQHRRRP